VTPFRHPAQYEKRAFAKGAAAFFHKPIDHEALLAAIRSTIGESAPPAADASDTVHVRLSADGTSG
jgi:FixJ family two-component response regulator